MGVSKEKTNILFLCVIFVLVICLAGVSYFAYTKNKDYLAVSTSLAENTTELDNAQAVIDELTAQFNELAESSGNNSEAIADLEAQLAEALKEAEGKHELEQQINELKAQIEQLKVEKRREELQTAIALADIKQATSPEQGICYLTFDDGPSDNTLKILDILDSYGVKGTFFVVGTAKTQYLSQISSRGHAIGLHTTTHKYDVLYKDINSYLEDVKGISDIVYEATGIRSNVLRFPGGSSNIISKNYCVGIMSDLTTRMPNLGYAYFDWNVDSGDAAAAKVSATTIKNNVLNGAKGKKSICVLMHDNGGKTTTVDALPGIIEGLKAMGFTFAPLTASSYGFHQPVGN